MISNLQASILGLVWKITVAIYGGSETARAYGLRLRNGSKLKVPFTTVGAEN